MNKIEILDEGTLENINGGMGTFLSVGAILCFLFGGACMYTSKKMEEFAHGLSESLAEAFYPLIEQTNFDVRIRNIEDINERISRKHLSGCYKCH